MAPISKMLSLGLNVGIGTDGPASNNDLDMFEETRLAAFVAKVATDSPTSLPARQAFAMSTSMGARALHIGHLTGSLEKGKRADIIAVDMRQAHNWPHFERSAEAIYSQLVYSAKSTDVIHVMCNGKWLMRQRVLLTIDTISLLDEADVYARQIDQFLTEREGDILSRLLAIGEIHREESFEIQVKVRLDDAAPVEQLLAQPDYRVVKSSHFRQHDTYFEFSEPTPARIRYREDDYLDMKGNVTNVRTRLTLTETGDQRELPGAIILSRSRYISPATRTLRFYREYFQANSERTIVKVRRRWHAEFNGKLFYFNLDRLTDPAQDGNFLEIKARTWSLKDADEKAKDILSILSAMSIDRSRLVLSEYVAI
jgi:5-methylthioadenosine/S-adenosylhomocysteine deaminase